MKPIWLLLLVASCAAAPVHAEISLRWNSTTQGLYVDGSVGGFNINTAPRDPVVPVPYVLTAPMTDAHMALQTISIALTMNQPGQKYVWESYQTGNYGRIDIYGEIDGVPRGCTGFEQVTFKDGQVYHEWFTACPGGGNVNTWIVNNRWIVNSLDRERRDDGCRVRFSDVRLDRERLESTAVVCYQEGADMWSVRQ